MDARVVKTRIFKRDGDQSVLEDGDGGHGVGASLVCATLGPFLACLTTYFISKFDVVRMRMWACFGVLLCASTVMVLYEIQRG